MINDGNLMINTCASFKVLECRNLFQNGAKDMSEMACKRLFVKKLQILCRSDHPISNFEISTACACKYDYSGITNNNIWDF